MLGSIWNDLEAVEYLECLASDPVPVLHHGGRALARGPRPLELRPQEAPHELGHLRYSGVFGEVLLQDAGFENTMV